MLDRILYVVEKSDASIITIICFITLLINRYNDCLLPLLRKFLLIPNRIYKFMDLTSNCSTPAAISSAGIWSVPGDFCVFSFSVAISTSKALGSGIGGSAICISVYLTSLTPCRFNSWEKCFLYMEKILWVSVTKSPPFLKSLMPLYRSLTFLNLLLFWSS